MRNWIHKFRCYDCRMWRNDFAYGASVAPRGYEKEWMRNWVKTQLEDIKCEKAKEALKQYGDR